MQQNNKENRSFKIITAVALCVAVLCLSVAYAALAQQLSIKGTANVVASNWNIDVPLQPTQTAFTGEGSISGTATNQEGVVAVDVKATLKKPGDSATLSFDVKNTGDIDAHLASITGTVGALSCKATPDEGGTSATDKEIVCENGGTGSPAVKYTITYDGTTITSGTSGISDLDLPKTEGSKTITVKVEYDTDATKIPATPVTVTLPTMTFAFQQGLNS